MERRLGKGLGSLLGDPVPDTNRNEVEVDLITPNPFQPRKNFDPRGLDELEDSIKNHGILQPIVLRRANAGYELISGERRWRAAKSVGMSRIPAVVRDNVGDSEMLELALVENVQRRDLNPIERAAGFKAMMDGLQLTQEGVAARVGLRRSTVTNHIRLLDLPDEVQEALAKGLVSMGHARAMLGLADRGAIVQLLKDIVRKDLSVRDVERIVREAVAPKPDQVGAADGAEGAGAGGAPPAWAAELERRMREHLSTKVAIQVTGEDTGRVVVDYFSREALDRICEVLAPREQV